MSAWGVALRRMPRWLLFAAVAGGFWVGIMLGHIV